MMWHRVKASDPLARSMRDRHYSTQKPGGRTVGPPGRRLVLISDDEQAMWITHWPDPRLVLDKIDALRCTVFRREGRRHERASVLIRAAMVFSEEFYGAAPAGWVTYVEPSKVRSQDPGYCFKMAGFELDQDFKSKRLIRLRRSPLMQNDPRPEVACTTSGPEAPTRSVYDAEPVRGGRLFRQLALEFA